MLAWGRSGSTILGNILGEADRFLCVGELHWLWQRALRQRCACGELVPDCPVWSAVLGEGFGYPDSVDPAAIWEWQKSELRVPHAVRIMRMQSAELSSRPKLATYAAILTRLYHSLAAVTGSDVIVDTSKLPSVAALLRLLPDIDPYFVHLVRDPRAVAFSWQRRRQRIAVDWEEEGLRYGPLHSSLRWLVYNSMGDALRGRSGARSTLLRYEDFVRAPRTHAERLVQLAGGDPRSLPFLDERTVELGVNHAVVGNPSRFRTGPITIRPDDQWLTEQSRVNRAIATAVAVPKLARYGYPLRARAVEGSSER